MRAETSYRLKIATSIHADDYDDEMEVSCPCRYSFADGVHRLKYDDEENGFTVIKITPDGEIQIRRRRSFSILLRKGYAHNVACETPYGTIPMVFTLQSADCSLTERGGRVEYVSQVKIDGAAQINRVIMELTEMTERID